MDSHTRLFLDMIEAIEATTNDWLASFDHSQCTGKVWLWRAPDEGSERFIGPDFRPRLDEVPPTQFLDELPDLNFRDKQLPNYQDRWIGAMRLPPAAFGPKLNDQHQAKLKLYRAIRELRTEEGPNFHATLLRRIRKERPHLSMQKAYRTLQVVFECVEDGTKSNLAFSFGWRQAGVKQIALTRQQAIEELHRLIDMAGRDDLDEKAVAEIEHYQLVLTGIKNRPNLAVVRRNTQAPMPVVNLTGSKTNEPNTTRMWLTAHASTPVLHRSEIAIEDLVMPKPMDTKARATGKVIMPLRSDGSIYEQISGDLYLKKPNK